MNSNEVGAGSGIGKCVNKIGNCDKNLKPNIISFIPSVLYILDTNNTLPELFHIRQAVLTVNKAVKNICLGSKGTFKDLKHGCFSTNTAILPLWIHIMPFRNDTKEAK